MIRYYIIFCILFLFIGCKSEKKETNRVIIEISEGFKKERKVNLSEIASDLKYIQLECFEDCLINIISDIHIIGNNIIVIDERMPQILRFDTLGNFLNKIGVKGRGPNEFIDIFKSTMNYEDSLLIVQDTKSGKLLFFDLEGNLIKSTSTDDFHTEMAYFEKRLYLAYAYPLFARFDNYAIRVMDENWKLTEQFINRSYEGISKRDAYSKATYRSVELQHYQDTLVYWDYKYDTIYSIYNSKIFPRYIISFEDKIPHNLLYNKAIGDYNFYIGFLETENYLFFNNALNKEAKREFTIVYDKKKGDCYNLLIDHKKYQSGFLNDIDGGPPIIPLNSSQDGKLICNFLPSEMKVYLKEKPFINIKPKNKVKNEKFLEILKNSKALENPVIIIVTLK